MQTPIEVVRWSCDREIRRSGDREQALRSCTPWRWLGLRFPGIYGHVEAVIDLRNRLNIRQVVVDETLEQPVAVGVQVRNFSSLR